MWTKWRTNNFAVKTDILKGQMLKKKKGIENHGTVSALQKWEIAQ